MYENNAFQKNKILTLDTWQELCHISFHVNIKLPELRVIKFYQNHSPEGAPKRH